MKTETEMKMETGKKTESEACARCEPRSPSSLLEEAGLKAEDLDEAGRKVLAYHQETIALRRSKPDKPEIQAATLAALGKIESAMEKLILKAKERQASAEAARKEPEKPKAGEPGPEKEKPKEPEKPETVPRLVVPEGKPGGKEIENEGPEEKPDKKAGERKTRSLKALEALEKEIGPELEACRERIREYNKEKREAAPAKPKKTLVTRLKERLLAIASLIPRELAGDPDLLQETEAILLETLHDLKEAWGMNRIRPAEKAIGERFDKLERAASEQKEEKGKKK